jgi:dihydroorotate dehydrogenase electron transfer subunit
MLHALCKLALENNTPCHVSLESPMACGLGICFSCVVKVKTEAEGGWDYKRICVDGPVFNAETLVLE